MASRAKLLLLLLSEDRFVFCVSLLPPLQISERDMRIIERSTKRIVLVVSSDVVLLADCRVFLALPDASSGPTTTCQSDTVVQCQDDRGNQEHVGPFPRQ